MQTFIMISIGAVLGANCRYWIGRWATLYLHETLPYGTLLVNLSGGFILGLLIAAGMNRFVLDQQWKALLVVGFLGSYTTFSSYTFESVNLMLEGQIGPGLLYLLGSSVLGGLAVLAGIGLGRMI